MLTGTGGVFDTGAELAGPDGTADQSVVCGRSQSDRTPPSPEWSARRGLVTAVDGVAADGGFGSDEEPESEGR